MNVNKIVFRFVSVSFSVLVLLLILVGFVKIGTACYDFGYRVFTEEAVDAAPGRDVTVQITSDMSNMDIAKELEEKGLVNDAKLFYVQLKVSAYSDQLNDGIYTLNTSMTARELMVALSAEQEEATEQAEDTETVQDTQTGDTQAEQDAGEAGQ